MSWSRKPAGCLCQRLQLRHYTLIFERLNHPKSFEDTTSIQTICSVKHFKTQNLSTVTVNVNKTKMEHTVCLSTTMWHVPDVFVTILHQNRVYTEVLAKHNSSNSSSVFSHISRQCFSSATGQVNKQCCGTDLLGGEKDWGGLWYSGHSSLIWIWILSQDDSLSGHLKFAEETVSHNLNFLKVTVWEASQLHSNAWGCQVEKVAAQSLLSIKCHTMDAKKDSRWTKWTPPERLSSLWAQTIHSILELDCVLFGQWAFRKRSDMNWFQIPYTTPLSVYMNLC